MSSLQPATHVAVVRGERSAMTVFKALELIDGTAGLTDRPVLIKVNLIAKKTWDKGATTDPVVVEALIQALNHVNERVYVVESDATITYCEESAKVSGIMEVCKKYGVPFVNLSKVKERVRVKISGPETLKALTVPRLVLEGHLISAAKMKTHIDTTVTLGMKNVYGVLPEKMKYLRYHLLHNMHKVIVDVNTVVKPALTIIDGFVAMEGLGPIRGDPVKMDLVVAGRSVVATDAIAARIMGFDPASIPHLKRAAEKGLGPIEGIQILGEDLEKVARKFKPARLA